MTETTTLWASDGEAREHFERETLPLMMGQTYYHPGGCKNCGHGPCYMLCPNHPFHYSAEDEMRDEMERPWTDWRRYG